MIILLAVLALICIWRIRISGYHEDYMDPAYTTAIKGFFVIIIFCSHIRGYMTLSGAWPDTTYNWILNYIGQPMVAIFFFYSGYGIWESFKRKSNYLDHFLGRRLMKVLLHFDVAVALFILVQLCIPIKYTAYDYIFSWIGWTSVGNSNWFIFMILCLYVIAFLGMIFESRTSKTGIIAIVLLTVVLWLGVIRIAKKPVWWGDTIAAFPVGFVFSQYKDKINTMLSRRGLNMLISAALLALFITLHHVIGIDEFGIMAVIFCLTIVALSSWIKIGNPVLAWLGKNAFTIYIIQRLPMIVLKETVPNFCPPLFVVASLISTLLLAELLSRLYAVIDRLLFENGRLA